MTKVVGAQGYASQNGWMLLNDVWNPGKLVYGTDYSIQATTGATSLTSGTTFSWSLPPTTFSYTNVVAYPDILFGDGPWGRGLADPTDIFPIQLTNLHAAQLGYNLAWSGATGGYDVSYDIFFTSVPNGGASAITNELMIWMHKGSLTPYGTNVGTYSDGGFSGAIYNSSSGMNGTYTAIVANTDSNAGTIDLANVVQTLESMNILNSSDYLTSIQLGAEVVQGAGSLTINRSTISLVSGNTNSSISGLGVLAVTPATEAVNTTDALSIKPFTNVAITDTIAGQTETATVALSAAANGTLSDPNAATDGSTVSNGVLTVSGSAAAVATALDGLVFTPTAHEVAPKATVTTTVTATITDTAGDTASATSSITATAVATVPPATDTIVLNLAEDYADGNGAFTVSVNGQQVGGIDQVNVLHASGDSGTVSLTGNWGSGVNDVAISFINHAYGRNLYVNSISENGVTYAGSSAAFPQNGSHIFAVGGTTPAASGAADILNLNLSEDAWKGDADFVLYIDGKAVTTPQAVTALHSANATQGFSFTGNFGAGTHTIGVGFVNDAYGGSSGKDRNLYVNGVTLNGSSVFSGIKAEDRNGISTFTATTTH
ncbi:MAG: hypothetical protein HIU92_18525 [Proteobacteria bacterium]|nr:hypothetical protein [Pseudomonadota bacterium]